MAEARRARSAPSGGGARAVAASILERIETDGAYANLALRHGLDRSTLDRRDRALVTELVYGVTRGRRALDWIVDRFVMTDPDLPTRTLLRLGAHQLVFLDHVPDHAAVSETVALAPRRTRGFVNAVLRRVAAAGPPDAGDWPDDATRLSVPDHVLALLAHDLGADDAVAALEQMNVAAEVTTRDDGYVQDPSSAWVVDHVGARSGEMVADLCAAPGGKATALAATGAVVVAADVRVGRCRLVATAAGTTGVALAGVVAADGAHPALRPRGFDRVLVDAPCSGLGVLRRRADARWRVGPEDPERLAALQSRLVTSAAALVRPGGRLVYSVCTLTAAETIGVATAAEAASVDGWTRVAPPSPPWRSHGPGGLVLPHDYGTDGMFVAAWQRPVD